MKMKLIHCALRSFNVGLPHKLRTFGTRFGVRAFSAGAQANESNNKFETRDDFEQRIFGGFTGNSLNDSPSQQSFFRKLDRAERAHNNSDYGSSGGRFNLDNRSEIFDDLDESFNTLSDGMDDKLKEAATCYDAPEILEDPEYEYRPDVNWSQIGDTYELRDLDIRKPGIWEPNKREEFETTTEEVLRKANFRNVRFLANFITNAGIIIKRSQTKISAKAQRKVAREIKTARAFGLMPFTTMGTKHFRYGKTMESLDADYEFETYDTSYNFVNEEASQAL
ncbi:uncharacterized protein LOC108211109 [Daucus carota subsp. sativus]|uniref:uncharacterized protein LOC108211109 n=1 Tax=Daucus carota subsp. sativus TaxID=79200 RepID=UPI0007EF2E07|nr:PREDICTED: uncharacterized protein LOC108211109 [Daucus carota subsp. sativus]